MLIFNKKNLIYITFVFFLSLQSAILHYVIFEDADYIFGCFMSFFFAFLFWFGIMRLPKFIVYICLTLKFLSSITLIIYHNFLSAPLTVSVIYHQFFEGFDAISKDMNNFYNLEVFSEIILFILNLYIWKKIALNCKVKFEYKILNMIPIVILFVAIWLNHSFYGGRVFLAESCKILGYNVCWISELSVGNNRQIIIDDMIEAYKTKYSISLNLKPTNNIYIIQVESLAYAPMNSKYKDKEILPFLNKISKEGGLTEVIQNVHGASSNTDLFVNIASYYENNPPVLYNLFEPEQIYSHFSLLAKKAQEKGYTTHFYHNYYGSFFSRNKHIPAQGYQDIYFAEDMEGNKPKEEWGIADRYLFEFVLAHQKKSAKNFNYLITVSSHSNYIVYDNKKPLFQGKDVKEKYYNAINYVDRSLEDFIEKSPSDSLFIIFGDHGVDDLRLKNIPLIVYSKQQNIAPMPKKISSIQMMKLIHSLIEQL